MRRAFLAVLSAGSLAVTAAETTSEISVDLKLDNTVYVTGERIRGLIDVANATPDRVLAGTTNATDLLFVEVFKASDMRQLDKVTKKAFTAPVDLASGEGQKFETFLGDHFGVREPSRYLARPVLVHRGARYEGMLRAFDVVPGLACGGALQMFSNRPGLKRRFSLVYWQRGRLEHLFVKAEDVEGATGGMRWCTFDLGPILRITAPIVSVMPNGEVVVVHRSGQDQYLRTVIWSMPAMVELRTRESVLDPETAGAERVKELYRQRGGVEAKKNPWWKFW